jgi:CBS domain-containing protein
MTAAPAQQRERPVPFAEATVADAMRAGIVHCAPETPIRTVARLTATHGIHAVFVFDYGDEPDETVELWGLVSDLDVAAAARADVDALTARQSAVTPLVTVRSDERLARAAELMATTGAAHLGVLDARTQCPVGVVSTLDIARALAAETEPRETQASI